MERKFGSMYSKKIYRAFLLCLPPVLLFSYQPQILIGTNESMNFELSLPLIWLGLLGIFVLGLLIKTKRFKEIFKRWYLLLFPLFLSFSVFWSLNFVRGVLVVGILWLLYLVGFSIYLFRDFLDTKFWHRFWQIVFGAGLFAVFVLILQCILDLVGVARETTLMCAGCVSEMFGFPHPNGFAIEPQFMGNLLLFPLFSSAWFHYRIDNVKRKRCIMLALSCIFAIGIFLTFSRGAIYAMLVGLLVLMVCEHRLFRRTLVIVAVVVSAFIFTLNLQGLMAELGPTSDTYTVAMAKVLNHLSLGIIDLKKGDTGAAGTKEFSELTSTEELEAEEFSDITEKKEPVFDGYVAESTNTRVRLNDAALTIWQSSPQTLLFGVGLGGAGTALYQNGLSPAPKEIIQNQYFSLLLETGLVGVALLIFTLVMILRLVYRDYQKIVQKKSSKLPLALRVDGLLALSISYSLSLMFFSGLPNALQIYLLPATVLVYSLDDKCFHGKRNKDLKLAS